MADTPPATTKPKGSTFGFLGKKVFGKIPVWVIAVGAVGGYYWYTHYGPGKKTGAMQTDPAGNTCPALNPATGYCPGTPEDAAAIAAASGADTGGTSGTVDTGGTAAGSGGGTSGTGGGGDTGASGDTGTTPTPATTGASPPPVVVPAAPPPPDHAAAHAAHVAHEAHLAEERTDRAQAARVAHAAHTAHLAHVRKRKGAKA